MPLDDAGAWTLTGTLNPATEVEIGIRRRELEVSTGVSTAEWFARRPLQTRSARLAKRAKKEKRRLKRDVLVRIIPAEGTSAVEPPASILDVEIVPIPIQAFSLDEFLGQ